MPPQNERDPRLRVLIVRLGAMGDILHALPAVAALRSAHPEWHIGWAVEPRWQPLLRNEQGAMPLLDRVHLVDAKQWARSPVSGRTVSAIRSLRRELRQARYDVCIDLQGAVRSALVGRLAGAARILGEARPREPIARHLFSEQVPTAGVHVIEQAVEVCQAIAGERLYPSLPPLPLEPAAEQWAEQIRGAAAGRRLVLLNPGAGWGAKRWPAERYGVVASALHGMGAAVLVNAGPEEQEIAAQVVRASAGAALAPEFTLTRLIAMVRRTDLFIAGDTGPLHLACALGTPVVGIYGPTDPRRNGPFGVPNRVLRHPESRRDHTRRAQTEAGLLTITPAEVVRSAAALLHLAPPGESR